MRKRDERFTAQEKYRTKPDPLFRKTPAGHAKEIKRFGSQDFSFNDDNTATCPAGQQLTSPGSTYNTASGLRYQN